jgi:putative PIN family toxin of toxin-antitoxin system
MKVVLDTNCFISCIGKQSLYRNVFDLFLSGHITLCFSTEILLEYEEVFLDKWGSDVTQNLLGRLVRAKNIEYTSIFFNFNVVARDADDNKFADAYLASNADYLISNDSALLVLNNSDFPPFKVLTLQAFSEMLRR